MTLIEVLREGDNAGIQYTLFAGPDNTLRIKGFDFQTRLEYICAIAAKELDDSACPIELLAYTIEKMNCNLIEEAKRKSN